MPLSRQLIRIACSAIALLSLAHLARSPFASITNGIEKLPRPNHLHASFDRRRYSVMAFGQRAGTLESWSSDDRTKHFHLEFKLAGHGPDVDESITLNDRGIPTSLELSGRGYVQGLECPMNDRFLVRDGKASWKNFAENGEQSPGRDGFYLSLPIMEGMLSAIPEEIALLARALLRAPNHKLALIPTSEATISRAGELRVEAGAASKTVVRYEINGLDFAPIPIWLEEDGTFFAITPGLNVIREGWESVLPALRAEQTAASRRRLQNLANELGHRPNHPIVFRHVNLFDSENARMQTDFAVVIVGNRIQQVGPDREMRFPKSAGIIDGRGKSLFPGFWDMHTYLNEAAGLRLMACGITTARDLGNWIDLVVEIRKNFDSGTSIGPRVILHGLIDGRGPLQAPTDLLVDTEEEARAAIERISKLGYAQVILYGSIKPELVPKIAEIAHSHGLKVGGQLPAFVTASQAVLSGYEEINHINYLFLNFMPDVGDTRTPIRYLAVAEHAADLDLTSNQVRSFMTLLRERNTVIDPSLSLYETRLTARPGVMAPIFAPLGDRLPLRVRRNALLGGVPVPAGKDQRYRDSFEAVLKMDFLLYKSSIRILTGSDAAGDMLPGLEYQRELELQVRAGIPPLKVLQLATIGDARVMKRDSELGSIRPGKLADMVLIDGNPAATIQDIRKVDLVMKDGTIYSAKSLNKAVNMR